jgi:hypothetical protein
VEILVGGDIDLDLLLLFPKKYASFSSGNETNQAFLRSTILGRLRGKESLYSKEEEDLLHCPQNLPIMHRVD